MRLYLINPTNPLVSIVQTKESRWNHYRVWKPLSLLVLAGLTPSEWDVTIFDENVTPVDYSTLPTPDLVGITAFTSQTNRAYQLAEQFRAQGVPVVMGGIHATMCQDEASPHVDSIVTGEAEEVWPTVLEDAKRGQLQPVYVGGIAAMPDVPIARHDLLPSGYAFGAIQTTRGCPLQCHFCSVSAFNGTRYRLRSIEKVIEEFRTIREKRVLIVDDNLIGTRKDHIERAKELFRAMIKANLRKSWICQVTVNMGDDEELLALAAKAGCCGAFIGFESPTKEGLIELGKKFNIKKEAEIRASVQRIQRHGILVVGSFIIGLDTDTKGIGLEVSHAARRYGVDHLNALFLTPLPGTRLWEQMESQDRIAMNRFPEDWKYYTLTFPVARYANLSRDEILDEMLACDRDFYSRRRIARRVCDNFLKRRKPLIALVGNLSYRSNLLRNEKGYRDFSQFCHGNPRPRSEPLACGLLEKPPLAATL